MGIQDLSKFVKDYKTTVLLGDLECHRFAVDSLIYLYRFVRGSQNWQDRLIEMIRALRKHFIKPIFIFDGPNVPQEKKLEQTRRKESDRKIKENLETLKTIKTQSLKSWEIVRNLFPKTNIPKPPLLDTFVRDKIKSMEISTRDVDASVIKEAKEIIKTLGMMVVDADGEAETLCVHLVYSGIVDGIFTNDTDVLAYTSDQDRDLVVVFDLDLLGMCGNFVSKRQLLIELDMAADQFRDMCILLGCDYNQRLPGFGIVNAQEEIRKHLDIETVLSNSNAACLKKESADQHVKSLNHQRCREIFESRVVSLEIVANSPVCPDKLGTLLAKVGSRYDAETVMSDWVIRK